MALSGVINSSTYDNTYLQLTWDATQSIENNTSTLNWKLTAVKGAGDTYYAGGFKVTIGGEVVYEYTGSRYLLRNGYEIAAGTKTISHNADGTKAVNISIEGAVYYYAVNCTGAETITLNQIPRTSTVSMAQAYIGSQATITVNSASKDFTHTIMYEFGDLSGTIVTQGSGSTFKWNIPTSFYYEIPASKFGSGMLHCFTYSSSGTMIGNTAASFTVLANAVACGPSIMPSATDTNSLARELTGGNYFVKHQSNVLCEMQAYAAYGASIVSKTISYGSKKINAYSHTIEKIEVNSVNFTVTDSRGYTVSYNMPIPLIEYVPLTCDLSDDKPDTEGNFNFFITGNYFNSTFGARQNSLFVQYRYGVAGGEYGEWTTVTPIITDNTYSAAASITGLDYQTTYDFQARAADELIVVYNTDIPPIRSTPVFDWSGEDFNFNVPVNFNEGATGLDGGGIYFGTCTSGENDSVKVVECEEFKELKKGASIRVYFEKSNGVTSPQLNVNDTGAKPIYFFNESAPSVYSWWVKEVKDFVYDGEHWWMVDGGMANVLFYGRTKLCNTITDDAGLALTPSAVYNWIKQGSWTPTCNLMSYPTQAIGTYIKIGKTVIVSWYLTGTTDSASEFFKIGNLPFTPASNVKWFSGGGNLSGALVLANQVFSCWNIEDGQIHARTATYASSQSARTSGYAGAWANATIHASGTICYQTN